MAKRGDKYNLSNVEQQLLNDPRLSIPLEAGRRINASDLPLDVQRNLGVDSTGQVGFDPAVLDILRRQGDISTPAPTSPAVKIVNRNQITPPVIDQTPLAQAASGVPQVANGSVVPENKRAQYFKTKGSNSDQSRGGGLVESLQTLINELNNKYVNPTINSALPGAIAGPLNIGADISRGFNENQDKRNIPVFPGVTPGSISDVIKGIKNKVFGHTDEAEILKQLQTQFPGADLKSELNKRQLSGLEGKTASGGKWRIMPDGTIQIVKG